MSRKTKINLPRTEPGGTANAETIPICWKRINLLYRFLSGRHNIPSCIVLNVDWTWCVVATIKAATKIALFIGSTSPLPLFPPHTCKEERRGGSNEGNPSISKRTNGASGKMTIYRYIRSWEQCIRPYKPLSNGCERRREPCLIASNRFRLIYDSV